MSYTRAVRAIPSITPVSRCLLSRSTLVPRSILPQKASLSTTSSTRSQHNNAEEIEKLNELIKVKLAEIEAAERKRVIDESKPKISDFKRPILMTLVIASTAYLAFHWIWWHLEHDEREKELSSQLEVKELELRKALEAAGQLDSQGKIQTKKNWWRLWSR